MADNSYDTGRLNLPFVGISTFGKNPYQPDWSKIDADFAILGAPFDFGTQFRAGARFGPRSIREASTLFSFGHAGAYDHEDDCTYLGPDVRIVDIGDAEAIVHCAAFVEQWGPIDAWKRFNIDGTDRMLKASREAGAHRFVHISTESVLWRGQHLRGVDETYPRAPNSPYPYSWTKARAEELCEAANAPTFQTIILRPRFIWGPGDTTLLPVTLVSLPSVPSSRAKAPSKVKPCGL